jgi:hypothetical protein
MEPRRLRTRWYLPLISGTIVAVLVATRLYGREGYSLAETFSPPLLQHVLFIVLVTVVGSYVFFYILDRIQR